MRACLRIKAPETSPLRTWIETVRERFERPDPTADGIDLPAGFDVDGPLDSLSDSVRRTLLELPVEERRLRLDLLCRND